MMCSSGGEMKQALALGAAVALLSAGAAVSQQTNLTIDEESRKFLFNGQSMSIGRSAQSTHQLALAFASQSQECPPHCIVPLSAGEGIATLGELELMSFLSGEVSDGKGLVIDARSTASRKKGFIPASINIPRAALQQNNEYRDEILAALGGKQSGGAWDFSNAYSLSIYANGPWESDAFDMLIELREIGYPIDKLKFYRGGMHAWVTLGLTIIQPQS